MRRLLETVYINRLHDLYKMKMRYLKANWHAEVLQRSITSDDFLLLNAFTQEISRS